jgi:leader peptidase (prepilin peptidase) / N-methyltransferase
MPSIFLILILIGLCFGSFINALVWRLYLQTQTTKKKNIQSSRYSILRGRSMCESCHHELKAIDLMPLFSWALLGGKCRYCGASISWQNPVIEFVLPLLYVISYVWWPSALNGVGLFNYICWLVVLTGFVALSVYDIRWYLLPDKIVYPLIGLLVVKLAIDITVFGVTTNVIFQSVLGILSISGIFFILYLVSKGTWIGFGDVKLGIILGLLAGGAFNALTVIFIASVLGSLVALPLLARRRVRVSTQLPFGPFLMLATMIVVLFGMQLTHWYKLII